MPSTKPRRIDHLVLPTASLDAARARLTALGFTVAPDGVHPFGTQNACVYFTGGAFLEPLAMGDPAAADAAVQAGNVFVARDRAYRIRQGDEGFSALVMGTGDARADHANFVQAGMSAGDMLAFSRPFVDANGKKDNASFLLAFADAGPAAPDSFFFTCERVNAPKVDRSALESHANGTTGIARVVLSAPDPGVYKSFFRQLAGGEILETSSGFDVKTATGTISVLNPTALEAFLGIPIQDGDSLLLRAIVFDIPDLVFLGELFSKNNVAFRLRTGHTIVAPAAGRGATLVFQAPDGAHEY